MQTTIFYTELKDAPGADVIEIRALGITEIMEPRIVEWTNREDPYYFFSFFHDEAECQLPDSGMNRPVANSLVIWNPLEKRHYGNTTKRWNHSWLIGNGSVVRNMLKCYQIPTDKILPVNAGIIFIKYLKLFNYELKTHPNNPDSFALSELMKLFLYELYRVIQNDQSFTVPENISKARDYMDENLSKDLTLNDLANNAAMSVSGFIASFKQAYEKTPMRYLNDTRMNLAGQLLMNRNFSIKEVSSRTGFEDQLYFSKKFRSYYKCSPTEFKERKAKALMDSGAGQ